MLQKRSITAIFFASAMLGGIFGGAISFFVLIGAVALGCLWELGGLLHGHADYSVFRRIMTAALGVLPYVVVGAAQLTGWIPLEIGLRIMVVGIVAIFSVLMFIELFLKSEYPFDRLGAYLIGILYVGLPFSLMVDLSVRAGVYTPWAAFGLIWLIWTSDSAAYLIGSRFGKRKLFERISPGKTWEGFAGALLITVATGWLFSLYLPHYGRLQWLVLSFVAVVAGTVGDLVESMLKRSIQVKDSGSLLPGHGGFLDRFDALVYSLPFLWAVDALMSN
jgi:phosphatidate cytidylyltransferase